MTIFYLAYGQATTLSTAELLLTDDRFNCEYYYFYPMARVKQNSDRSLQQTSNNTIGQIKAWSLALACQQFDTLAYSFEEFSDITLFFQCVELDI